VRVDVDKSPATSQSRAVDLDRIRRDSAGPSRPIAATLVPFDRTVDITTIDRGLGGGGGWGLWGEPSRPRSEPSGPLRLTCRAGAG